jgi:hypothetical protein
MRCGRSALSLLLYEGGGKNSLLCRDFAKMFYSDSRGALDF